MFVIDWRGSAHSLDQGLHIIHAPTPRGAEPALCLTSRRYPDFILRAPDDGPALIADPATALKMVAYVLTCIQGKARVVDLASKFPAEEYLLTQEEQPPAD